MIAIEKRRELAAALVQQALQQAERLVRVRLFSQ